MTTECAVSKCSSVAAKRGWCNLHYKRWRRHGDPAVTKRHTDPFEGLEARTEQRGECLVWTGETNENGYGRMSVRGKKVSVHRWAWEQAHGAIPPGIEIDHRCRNRACVNPRHLRLATHKQNMEHLGGPHQRNKSGRRGVTWDSKASKWVARVQHNGKIHRGGWHNDIESAAAAAKALRLQLFTRNDLDRAA